jgi:hypothetical protein
MEDLSKVLKELGEGQYEKKTLMSLVTSSLIPMTQTFRQRFDVRWYLNDAYYKGNQWIGFNKFTQNIEEVRLEPWRDKIVINICQVTLDAMQALLTNKRPAFYVGPEENDNKKLPVKDAMGQDMVDPATGGLLMEIVEGDKVKQAKFASNALETIGYDIGFRRRYMEMVHDALKMGNGFLKVFWDMTLRDNEGEVNVGRVSPFALYVDPLCVDNVTMKDARFIIEVVQCDSLELSLQYNRDIKPDNKQSESDYESLAKNSRNNNSSGPNIDSNTTLKYLCWLKVPYATPLMMINDAGEEYESETENTIQHKTFCLVMTKDVVLDLLEDPTGYNEHPYVGYPFKPIPGEFYGQGIITAIRDMNDQINRRMSQMAENATMMGNPRLKVRKGTMDRGAVTNQPGAIVHHMDEGGGPVPMVPANVSTDVQTIVNMLSSWVQDVSQTHDVSIGRVPPNVTSGLQVELLQAADSNVLSPHFEAFEDSLKEVARKMLLTMKAKYPSGRTFSTRDKAGNMNEFEFDPRNFNFSDVRVEIDSALAHTKAGRQNLLMEMVEKKIISVQKFLEDFGGFNKDSETILKQLQEEAKWRSEHAQNNPQPQQGQPVGQEQGLPPGQ